MSPYGEGVNLDEGSAPSPVGSRNPDNTRRAILDAAAEVVWNQGESAVRVAKIGRTAGVTTGAIYAHFGSREGLLAAVHTEFMNSLVQSVVELLDELVEDSDSNPAMSEGYASLIRRSITGDHADRARRWAAAASRSLFEPELQASIHPIERGMVMGIGGTIAQSQVDGWFDPNLDPTVLGAIFFGGVMGMAVTFHPFADDSELLEDVVKAWQRVVVAFEPVHTHD